MDLDLGDVAYTLAVGRMAFGHRSIVVARNRSDCIAKLASEVPGLLSRAYQPLRNVPVAFVFPGEEAGRTHLGQQLYDTESHYRDCVAACLIEVERTLGLSLTPALESGEGEGDAPARRVCLFIHEYALATAWIASGIQPRYLVGRGLGEYVAACVAGMMGVADAVSRIAKGVELPVIPAEGREASSLYRFTDESIARILDNGATVFLEVGPGSSLTSHLRNLPEVTQGSCIASLPESDARSADGSLMHRVLAELWLSGASVDWQKFYADRGCRRTVLPSYPFEKHRYWIETRPTPSAAAGSSHRGTAATGGGHCSLPVWKRMPFVSASQLTPGGSCLLFDDGSQLAEALKVSLAACSIATITVTAGWEFARRGEQQFVIDPEREYDYERLLRELTAGGPAPRMLLHLWGVGGGHPDQTAFWSLYSFVKAWTRVGISPPLYAGVLSSEVENVSGSERIAPEKSLVLGGCQAIQHEISGGRSRHFDISFRADPSWQTLKQVARDVVREVSSEPGSARIAYRDGHRWVLDLETVLLNDTPASPAWVRDGGVYWITGGTGGIGVELADFLTQQANVTVVLAQRSELPARGRWSAWIQEHGAKDSISALLNRIASMEARGSTVVLERVDVTDVEAVNQLYEKTLREYGVLNGIIHAAGVAGGGLLALKSRADVWSVLAPKVLGTQAIQTILRLDAEFDFLVLCSSVTALTGGPGRSDYGAANCFLDAFATECNRNGSHVVSINWDAWSETGMAVSQRTVERKGPAMAVGHPLLDTVQEMGGGRLFATHFTSAAHWIARDHLIFGAPTIPGVAYIEMIAAALLPNQGHGKASLQITDLRFIQPLALADVGTTAYMEVREDSSGYGIRLLSGVEPEATLHAQASAAIVPGHGRRVMLDVLARGMSEVDLRGLQPSHDAHGPLQLGPAWNVRVTSCHTADEEFLASLELPEVLLGTAGDYHLHVSLFDVATSFALRYLSQGHLYLPVHYQSVRIYARMPPRIYSHVRHLTSGVETPEVMTFDISIFDPMGNEIVSVERFSVKKVGHGIAATRTASPERDAGAASTSRPYGLSSRAGVDAFAKILGQPGFPQIVVSAAAIDAREEPARADPARTDPGVMVARSTRARPRPELAAPYAPPSNDMEAKLAQIWQEILGVEPIGIDDDYIDLGGDSLLATRLVDRIVTELNTTLSIVTLYDRPTVRELAWSLQESPSEPDAGADRAAALAGKARMRAEFLNRGRVA
jgi:phthiocerol/phenolphthiocerol synthesis type-I polyketide synthase E